MVDEALPRKKIAGQGAPEALGDDLALRVSHDPHLRAPPCREARVDSTRRANQLSIDFSARVPLALCDLPRPEQGRTCSFLHRDDEPPVFPHPLVRRLFPGRGEVRLQRHITAWTCTLIQKGLGFCETRDLKFWGNPWYKLDDGNNLGARVCLPSCNRSISGGLLELDVHPHVGRKGGHRLHGQHCRKRNSPHPRPQLLSRPRISLL